MRDFKDLRGGQHLRRFAMITAHLRDAFFQPFGFGGGFGFSNGNGNAVNEENGISTIAEGCALLRPFICDVKLIVGEIVEINQPDITFTFFFWNEDRLFAA